VKLKIKFEIDGICINKKARDENFWKKKIEIWVNLSKLKN
jgi:hypothetical protein